MLAMLFFTLLGLTAVGVAFLLATGSWRERDDVEFLGLAILLGQGLGALLAFWASLAGLVPGRWALGMVAVAGGVTWRFRRRWPAGGEAWREARRDPVCLVAFAAILAAVTTIAAQTLAMPLHEWDAFAIWGLKAKVVVAAPVLANDYFQDLSLNYSHLDYPLLVPFLMSLPAGAAGIREPSAAGLVFAIQAMGLALCLQGLLRQHLSGRTAWLLTAILLTFPATVHWGGGMIADFTVSAFLLVTAAYLWRWLETARRQDLATGCLAGVCLLFTKNEGLAASAVVVAVVGTMLLVRRQPRRLGGLAVGVGAWALASLPWFWFMTDLPGTQEQYGSRLRLGSLIEQIGRLPEILVGFGQELLTASHWGAALALLAVALWTGGCGWRRWLVASPLLIVVGQAAIYLMVLMVTPWRLSGLLPIVMDRLLLHLAPLAVFCAAVCMAEDDRGIDG